jgi:RNA polymerase sigma factor (sigma-70 family)
MVYRPLQNVLQHLRRLAFASDLGGLDDAHLLGRFLDHQDESAFETLVRRHGPMVLGVCQRLLTDPRDIEDAFQVTFLVLLRKARSLSRRDRLASWLYGVARRTAMKARTLAARRQAQERPILEEPVIQPEDALIWHDLRPVLDEELSRLPAKYRVPVILCYLEGKTFEEAARQLGWPAGTVSGRLARARELLRKRLTRRGVTLSAGLAGTLFSESTLAAVVPGPLVISTLRAAVILTAAKTGASGALAAHVAALMEGVLHQMFLTKVKLVTLGLLALALLTAGAGVVRYQRLAAQQPAANGASDAVQESARQPTETEQLETLMTVDVDRWNKAVDATTMSDRLKTLLKERLEAARNEAQARWRSRGPRDGEFSFCHVGALA